MASAYMKSKMRSYIQAPAIMDQLTAMLDNDTYHTLPGYSINTESYPDNTVPFVESHMNYLSGHPQVDPEHYLSNLRLMLKIR